MNAHRASLENSVKRRQMHVTTTSVQTVQNAYPTQLTVPITSVSAQHAMKDNSVNSLSMPVPTVYARMVPSVYQLLTEAAQSTLALVPDVSLDSFVKKIVKYAI